MKCRHEVARRALIQGNLSLRAQFENHAKNGNQKAQGNIVRHQNWLNDSPLTASMSSEEQEWFGRQPGDWDNSLIQESFWKVESFKGLLWCLSIFGQMPAYFEMGDVNAVYQLTQFPRDAASFVDNAFLRPPQEIEDELEVYRFLHWRCRTELFRLQGMIPPTGDSFEATVARALTAVPAGSTMVAHDDKDILIKGVHLTEYHDKGTVMSTCIERHLALEWATGDETWAETRTDT